MLNNTSDNSSNNSTDNSSYISSSCTSSSSDKVDSDTYNFNFTGKTLRHYNILNEIGKGAYSIVWLSYNTKTNNFYAIKVHDPSDFKVGMDEIRFTYKLPKNPPVFNNLVEYFITHENNTKYLCSVWNLHNNNLDSLIRKKLNKDDSNIIGLPFICSLQIINQLITALDILHNKYKVYHGDIKPDNILIKGISECNKMYCDIYIKLLNENKLSHSEITDHIIALNNNNNINECIDYNIQISLADFGTYCENNKEHTSTFGTRYYQAPEIILGGSCSYPVDIWALGCTFYEILTGNILFDPIKDSSYSRDYYHLCLINDTCGPFTYSFISKTKHFKNFFNSNGHILDYKTSSNRLDRKLENINENDKIRIKKILVDILKIDPKRRPTIKHVYNICN